MTVAVAKCCVIIVAGLTNDDMCKDTEVSSHVKIKMINTTIILNVLSSTINCSKRKEMRSSDIFWKLREGKCHVQRYIISSYGTICRIHYGCIENLDGKR